MYLNRNNLTSHPNGDRLARQIKSERDFKDTIVNSRQSEQLSTTEIPKPEQIDLLNDEGIAFVLSIFLFIFAAGFILKTGLQKISKDGAQKSKCGSKIACRKCYFFNKNYYLRCAVHPHKVLTKNAADCRDYQPKK